MSAMGKLNGGEGLCAGDDLKFRAIKDMPDLGRRTARARVDGDRVLGIFAALSHERCLDAVASRDGIAITVDEHGHVL